MNHKLLHTTKHACKVLDVIADEFEITLVQDKDKNDCQQISLSSLEDIDELTSALNDIRWWWEEVRLNAQVTQ